MVPPARLTEFLRLHLGTLLAGGLLALLLVDSVGSPDKVQRVTGVSSLNFIVPVLLAAIALRLRRGVIFTVKVERIIFAFGAFLTAIVSVLAWYGSLSPANTVYALTRLQLLQLWLVVASIVLLHFIQRSRKWWQEHWQEMIMNAPYLLFYFCFILALLPFDVFKEVVKEDKFIEYGQFTVLVLGSLASFYLSVKMAHRKIAWGWVIVYALCGVALAAVAGDEIAWGQRIFQIEVGEAVRQLNRQEEITVHNMYAVEWLVAYVYAFVSFVGLTSRAVTRFIGPLKRFSSLMAPSFLHGYFVFTMVFYSAQLVVPIGIWHAWSEVAELSLYSGCVLWLVLVGKELLSPPRLRSMKKKR